MPSYKIVASVLSDLQGDEIKTNAKKALEKSGFGEVYIKSVENEREYAFVDENQADGPRRLMAALNKEFFEETRFAASSAIKKSWRGVPLDVYPFKFDLDLTDPETNEKISLPVDGQLVQVPDDVAVAFGTWDTPGEETPEPKIPSGDMGEPESNAVGSDVAEDDIVKRGRGRPTKASQEKERLKITPGYHIYSWKAVALPNIDNAQLVLDIAKEIESKIISVVEGPLKGRYYPGGTSSKTEPDPDTDNQMAISAGVFISPVAPEDIPSTFSTEEANQHSIFPKPDPKKNPSSK